MKREIRRFAPLLALLLILPLSCTAKVPQTKQDEPVRVDTVYIVKVDTVYAVKINTVHAVKIDTVHAPSVDCFIANYKLERIQRYIDLTESRPANKAFFYGWIRRVMEEE